MATMRTTFRIDHEENDPKVRDLIALVKKQGFRTSHLKGVIQTKKLNG